MYVETFFKEDMDQIVSRCSELSSRNILIDETIDLEYVQAKWEVIQRHEIDHKHHCI